MFNANDLAVQSGVNYKIPTTNDHPVYVNTLSSCLREWECICL